MGLVWSQRETTPPGANRMPVPQETIQPLTITLEARIGDGSVASGSFIQRYVGPGVERRDIREDGLVGTLFLPAGEGPHPAVMIMSGSGGGIMEQRAALYASRGYAALALGYFAAPGLSPHISNTNLEYFQTGLRWIRRRLRPAGNFVAITGQSRGGELVLLLGSLFPDEVSAVIAYVPAAYIHSSQSAADPKLGRTSPTWLLQGKPLPHLWENNRTGTYEPYDNGPMPRRLEYTIKTALADRRAAERARIPVEKIRAPVLLVGGTDDGWWPTDYYCDIIEETLKDAKHPYPVTRLRYVDAGHSILFPYVPTTAIIQPHPVSGILSTGGGTPEANAVANEQSWAGVQAFLREAFDAHREK
jgi:dienelactone hydrolase